MKPSEAWLQYVWQNGLFKPGLRTTCGKPVLISDRGLLNHDAGPDFSNAVIRIGDTDWAGQVEIHMRSSDWIRHGHHLDPAYDNVILHVVLEPDEEVPTSRGESVTTLSIASNLYQDSWNRYLAMLNRKSAIPCKPFLQQVSDLHFLKATESLAAERLQKVVEHLNDEYQLSGLEPDQLAYQRLGRAMGFQVNADAFSILCKAAPYRLVRKYLAQPVKLESLLLGAAGMLKPGISGYAGRLEAEWKHISQQYDLFPMSSRAWRYARTRHYNNPELRIAQFAGMLHHLHPLYDVLAKSSFAELRRKLQPKVSAYWREHSRLNGSKHPFSGLGDRAIDTLLINTVLPLRQFDISCLGSQETLPPAFEELAEISPEENRITRMWKKTGFAAGSALETQGQIQLFRFYCRRKRCLQCPVSLQILDTASVPAVG